MKSLPTGGATPRTGLHLASQFTVRASRRPYKHHGLDSFKKPGHSLHHIIPWSLIKNTINAIVKTGDASLWWELADLFQLPNDLRYLPNITAKNKQTSLICWAPFNLVDGPLARFRDDDPGGGFDDFSSALDDPQLIERMHRLRDLHRSMESYTNNVSPQTRSELFFQIKITTESCKEAGVICFEEVAWRISIGGFCKRAA